MTTNGWIDTLPPETKLAVIIPLYGFWTDAVEPSLTAQVLQATLFRATSSRHKVYYFFSAELDRTPKDIQDTLTSRSVSGNSMIVRMEMFSSYSEYVNDAIEAALSETDCQFVLVLNPWTFLRTDSVDLLVERLNKKNVAIVSSEDLRTYPVTTRPAITADELDTFQFNPPIEIRDMNIDFWGMTRQVAEMFKLDTEFRSHYFVARDIWQQLFSKGLEVIKSQHIPVYSLGFNWCDVDFEDDYRFDFDYFMKKWHFDPLIKYE